MDEHTRLDGLGQRSPYQKRRLLIVGGVGGACVVVAVIVVVAVVVSLPAASPTHATNTTTGPPTTTQRSLNFSFYIDDLQLTIDTIDLSVMSLFYKGNRTDHYPVKMNGVLHTGFVDGSKRLEMGGDAACLPLSKSCLFFWHVPSDIDAREDHHKAEAPEAQLLVTELPRNTSEVVCYEISWESSQELTEKVYFEDCYDYSSLSLWYGAFEHENQPYGLNGWEKPLAAFIPGDGSTGQWGGVMERYFLGWNGFALHVDWKSPLFVSVKNNTVCLRSQITPPYQANPTWYPSNSMLYHFCSGPDIATTHKEIISRFYTNPSATPEPSVFQRPVWSVTSWQGTTLDQQSVSQLVTDLVNHDYTASNVEIDDLWATHYGDVEFDKDRFANVTEMMRQIHAAGLRVTLWVSPYANNDSRVFDQSVGSGDLSRWLRDAKNPQEPLLVKWKHGTAAVLDLSSPEGMAFFTNVLRNLSDSIGVDGFTFEAGDATTLGTFGAANTSLSSWPWQFTRQYANVAAAASGAEVSSSRVGCRSQELSMFIRMLPRHSNWSSADGLQSVIPAALAMSLAGYPFTWPDVIGGSDGWQPDRELYIRWVQLSAFLPVMHFSMPPWVYDPEVETITRHMVALHDVLVTPYLLQAAGEADDLGFPIIRPLWWLCPYDVLCGTINDQFLIGDALLVAPILSPGATERSVYLPSGKWLDHVHNATLDSFGQLFQHLTVNLDEILYFTKT